MEKLSAWIGSSVSSFLVKMTEYSLSKKSDKTYGTYSSLSEPSLSGSVGKNGEPADILNETIGHFGKWQFRISLMMALLKFPMAWFQLGIIFLAPPTQYWCKPPKQYKNLTEHAWIALSRLTTTSNQTNDHLDHCLMRDVVNGTQSTIPCLWGYDYNRTVFHSSVITEWDLVCSRARLVDVAQITLMLGVLIGNILFGITADRYGRKKTLMLCIFFQSACGMISAWSPWFWGFVLFRFILAVANGGTMITSFVMCMEVVGGRWRTIVPILYQIPFGIGNSIMGGLAYMLRDWRELQFTLCGLSGLYILYMWCVPESPRWLLAVGKRKQALSVLENAAITNGLNPDGVKTALEHFSNLSNIKEKPKFSAVFVEKKLRIRTILLWINWLICGINFYAFSQYLGQVGSNLFLTVGLSGLIAIPGTLLCVFVVGRCGRRWTIGCSQLLTALCFLAILGVPKGVFAQDWPRVLFAGLGVVGMSVSIPALYLFTGELYPTIIRNAGVGAAVMFSRIGSMLAPLVIALHDVTPFLPLLVLAGMAGIEALLVIPLPETKGMVLPEKIEDLYQKNISKTENGNYISVPSETKDHVED